MVADGGGSAVHMIRFGSIACLWWIVRGTTGVFSQKAW
jgi:hypothetical protein